MYSVALKKSIMNATDRILAPDLAADEMVDVSLEEPSGPTTAATVVATDPSQWYPPPGV